MVYGTSVVLNKLMALLIVPIYARVLTTEELGIYDIAFTFATLLNLIGSLEILQGVSRYWPEQPNWYAKRLLTSTGFWFVIGTNIFLSIFFITTSLLFVNASNYNDLNIETVINIILYGLFYSVYSYLINQFRWEMRSNEYTLVVVLMTFLNLALLIFFCLFLQQGLHGAIMAQTLSYMIAGLVALFWLRRTFLFSFDMKLLNLMLKFSFPLVFSSLSIFFIAYANRFSLAYYTDLEEIGKLAVIMKIAGLLSLLYSGIQIALTPIIYNNYQKPSAPKDISNFFTWFCAVSALSLCAITFFANELIIVFLGHKYLSVAPLIVYAAIGLLLSQMYIFAPGLPLAKKSSQQMFTTLASGILGIILNVFLVKYFLLNGAIIAFMLSNAAFFFIWATWGNKYYPIPWQWSKIILSIAIAAIAFLCNKIIDLNSEVIGIYAQYVIKIFIIYLVYFIYVHIIKSIPTLRILKIILERS